MGGSICLELDKETDVQKIKKGWKATLFGRNEGLVPTNVQKNVGVVRHVYLDEPDESI